MCDYVWGLPSLDDFVSKAAVCLCEERTSPKSRIRARKPAASKLFLCFRAFLLLEVAFAIR